MLAGIELIPERLDELSGASEDSVELPKLLPPSKLDKVALTSPKEGGTEELRLDGIEESDCSAKLLNKGTTEAKIGVLSEASWLDSPLDNSGKEEDKPGNELGNEDSPGIERLRYKELDNKEPSGCELEATNGAESDALSGYNEDSKLEEDK